MLIPFEDIAEITNAGSGQCLHRAGGQAIDADISATKVNSKITDRCLKLPYRRRP